MASLGLAASNCIEISSDEDSEEDFTAVGLSSSHSRSRNAIAALFKSFTRKCTQHGLSNDTISYAWNIFEKANTNFLIQEEFISFLRAAAERLNKGNVRHLVTSICQCLCTESVSDLTSLNFSQARTRTRRAGEEVTPTKQLEAAKGKLIEFISKQCIARKLIQKQPQGGNHAGPPNSHENATISSMAKEQEGINLNLTTTEPGSNKIDFNGGPSDIGGVKSVGTCVTSKLTGSGLVSSTNVTTHQLMNGKSLKEQIRGNPKTISTPAKATHVQTPTMKRKCVTPAPTGDGTVVKKAKGTNDIADNGTEDDDSDDVIFVSVTHHAQPQVRKSSDCNEKQEARPKLPSATLAKACNSQVNSSSSAVASKEAKRQKKKMLIKSMKTRLKFYDKEIKRLAQAELSLDEMDNADSSYIRESKMKEKYARLHKKLCMLQGSDDLYDEQPYAGVKIIGCPYPEINREAEKYVRSKKRFPDFFEIKKIVGNANKNYSIGLKSPEELDIAREVFSEIGDKLQRRRKKEFTKYSGSFLTDKVKTEADPALHDPHLKKQLKTNKKISKQKTEEVFKHYSRLQYEGCDTNTISSDDEEIAKQVIETQKKVSPGPLRKRVKVSSTLSVNGVRLEKVHTSDDKSMVADQQNLKEENHCPNNGKEDTEKNQWVGNSCVPKRLFPCLSTQSQSKLEETKVVNNSPPKTALQKDELTSQVRCNIAAKSHSNDGSLTQTDKLGHTQPMQSKLETNQRNTLKSCSRIKLENVPEGSFSGVMIMNGQANTSSMQTPVRQPSVTSTVQSRQPLVTSTVQSRQPLVTSTAQSGYKQINGKSTSSFTQPPLTSNNTPKMNHKLHISEKMEKVLKRVKPALVNYLNGNTSPLSKNQQSKDRTVNGSLERADAGSHKNLSDMDDSVSATTAHQSKTADSSNSSEIIIIDIDSDDD